jgi:hypothetical protein
MTKQIRKNVFETNSSSSHSLTLSASDIVAQPFEAHVLRAGVLTLEKGEFGWTWERFYQAERKAAYLFTQIFHDDIPEGEAESVTKALREQSRQFDMLCRVIEEHTGVKVLATPGSEGYVDHDSDHVGMDLFHSEEKLRQFLFSPESFLETGNDNSPPDQVIPTDRGSEHYYAPRYREPNETDVAVKLQAVTKWHYGAFLTEAGARLEHDSNREVFAALQAQATVTALNIDCQMPSEPFQYSEPMGATMSDLADAGFAFSEHLTVQVTYKRVSRREEDKHYDRRVFTFRMPKELADRLAALPASPKPAVDLKD